MPCVAMPPPRHAKSASRLPTVGQITPRLASVRFASQRSHHCRKPRCAAPLVHVSTAGTEPMIWPAEERARQLEHAASSVYLADPRSQNKVAVERKWPPNGPHEWMLSPPSFLL